LTLGAVRRDPENEEGTSDRHRLTLASRREVRGLGRWIVRATAAFVAGLIAFSLLHHFWLSTALLVPVGFAMIVQTAASNTLI
jgi:hypothetical protein